MKKVYKIDKEAYASLSDGRTITDEQAVKFALKHMRFRDWFNPVKVGLAVLESWYILEGGASDKDFKDVEFRF